MASAVAFAGAGRSADAAAGDDGGADAAAEDHRSVDSVGDGIVDVDHAAAAAAAAHTHTVYRCTAAVADDVETRVDAADAAEGGPLR